MPVGINPPTTCNDHMDPGQPKRQYMRNCAQGPFILASSGRISPPFIAAPPYEMTTDTVLCAKRSASFVRELHRLCVTDFLPLLFTVCQRRKSQRLVPPLSPSPSDARRGVIQIGTKSHWKRLEELSSHQFSSPPRHTIPISSKYSQAMTDFDEDTKRSLYGVTHFEAENLNDDGTINYENASPYELAGYAYDLNSGLAARTQNIESMEMAPALAEFQNYANSVDLYNPAATAHMRSMAKGYLSGVLSIHRLPVSAAMRQRDRGHLLTAWLCFFATS
jgi:hypothetical protein